MAHGTCHEMHNLLLLQAVECRRCRHFGVARAAETVDLDLRWNTALKEVLNPVRRLNIRWITISSGNVLSESLSTYERFGAVIDIDKEDVIAFLDATRAQVQRWKQRSELACPDGAEEEETGE